MQMKQCIAAVVAAVAVGGAFAGQAKGDASENAELVEARDLVDGYFGDPTQLERAAVIVGAVLNRNPKSAAGYVEAARITVKRGQTSGAQFEPGTMDTYRALVAKALELDPDNASALSLRAEIYMLSGAYDAAFDAIQHGLRVAPADPWLKLKLVLFYENTGERSEAGEVLRSIMTPACDTDLRYRRACVRALILQIERFALPQNVDPLHELAQRLLQLRDPRDAWSLGDLGVYFADADQLDEAADYERQALRVMDYGRARVNLAAILYAKAAVLQEGGRPNAALLKEADALGVPEEQVLDWYRGAQGASKTHASGVLRIFEGRAGQKLQPGEPAVDVPARST